MLKFNLIVSKQRQCSMISGCSQFSTVVLFLYLWKILDILNKIVLLISQKRNYWSYNFATNKAKTYVNGAFSLLHTFELIFRTGNFFPYKNFKAASIFLLLSVYLNWNYFVCRKMILYKSSIPCFQKYKPRFFFFSFLSIFDNISFFSSFFYIIF